MVVDARSSTVWEARAHVTNMATLGEWAQNYVTGRESLPSTLVAVGLTVFGAQNVFAILASKKNASATELRTPIVPTCAG